MNNKPNPDRDKLDRLLDETLSNLPEREAPANLFSHIMARVAEEEEKQRLSWFVKLQWPVVAVSAIFIFVASYFSNDLVVAALSYFNTPEIAGNIEDVNFVFHIASTLVNACGKVFGLIPTPILYGIVAMVVVFSSFSFAGLGTVLFRIAQPNRPLTTH